MHGENRDIDDSPPPPPKKTHTKNKKYINKHKQRNKKNK